MSKIEEIVERECRATFHDMMIDERLGVRIEAACHAVAKAVVEEAKRTFWKDTGYCRVCGHQQELAEEIHAQLCESFDLIRSLAAPGAPHDAPARPGPMGWPKVRR